MAEAAAHWVIRAEASLVVTALLATWFPLALWARLVVTATMVFFAAILFAHWRDARPE